MSHLILALPSKGRLQEQALDYLADAGLALQRSGGARDYTARLRGAADVSVSLLSAAEIAEELISGHVHLGVTGEDLLAEQDAGSRVITVERLGFGRANVVVAVPRCWIDVATIIPFYIDIFMAGGSRSSDGLLVLELLELLRLARIFKLLKHYSGWRVLLIALENSYRALMVYSWSVH